MERLKTIQKNNNLHEVYEERHHKYTIKRISAGGFDELRRPFIKYEDIAEIQFQEGGRNTEGSIAGVLDTDLLEIVRDRLKHFQSGQLACRDNAVALTKIEEALFWLNKRVDDRAERNVLGTDIK